ncbi:MAG: AAA family ATPase [Mycolicibacterium sp.]|uniref:AAA family ATPase n=1 Tax=Mycolicibacterium sp. TaxID=2320850 RepID=UPI000FB6AD54|nr:AAA family ATPase [Mycolicibacterium sp.]RUP35017.1 MAG: AAA family ATPase [Mycolicibacterium sp.]
MTSGLGRAARVEWASSIRPKKQVWLWENRIPVATVSALAGRGGTGKTTYALHLIAQLSKGLLPGKYYGDPRPSLIWSGEDAWPTVINPRAIAAGADLNKVGRLIIESTVDGDSHETSPRLPLDTEAIHDTAAETGAALILIDPIASTMNGDLNREADVRSAVDALARVADKTGAVVMFVRHFGKGGGNASDKMSGSHAFRDAVRSVFLFAADGDRVIVTQDKGNYAPPGDESFAFRLEDVSVPTDDGPTAVARVVELGTSDTSVSDVINRAADAEGEADAGERTAAEHWLEDYLTANGPTPSKTVKTDAAKEKISEATLKRAKKKLGVLDRSEGFPRTSTWLLPSRLTEQSGEHDSRGAEPTEPTGGEQRKCTEPTGSDMQSAHGPASEPTGEPTGSDTCRHCGEPLIFDDDKRDGYHSSKTACVKAQQTRKRANLTVIDGKPSVRQWLKQHTAELHARGIQQVNSRLVFAAGEAQGYSLQALRDARYALGIDIVAKLPDGSNDWWIDHTNPAPKKQTIAEWADNYLQPLPDGAVVDIDDIKARGEAAGHSWDSLRRIVVGRPDIDADDRGRGGTTWTIIRPDGEVSA